MATRDVRGKVMSAAKRVFPRKGYSATTVADIIGKAGIARATFYKYFPNKRQVFFELFMDMFKTLYENAGSMMMKESDSLEGWADRVRECLVLFFKFFMENREVVLLYQSEALSLDPRLFAVWDDFDRRMNALFSGALEKGIKRGVFRPVDVRVMATVLLMMFVQVPYRYCLNRRRSRIDVESMAAEIVMFAVEGLRPPAAG